MNELTFELLGAVNVSLKLIGIRLEEKSYLLKLILCNFIVSLNHTYRFASKYNTVFSSDHQGSCSCWSASSCDFAKGGTGANLVTSESLSFDKDKEHTITISTNLLFVYFIETHLYMYICVEHTYVYIYIYIYMCVSVQYILHLHTHCKTSCLHIRFYHLLSAYIHILYMPLNNDRKSCFILSMFRPYRKYGLWLAQFCSSSILPATSIWPHLRSVTGCAFGNSNTARCAPAAHTATFLFNGALQKWVLKKHDQNNKTEFPSHASTSFLAIWSHMSWLVYLRGTACLLRRQVEWCCCWWELWIHLKFNTKDKPPSRV